MSDDILIIGGGFAGLAAGIALADSGCRVRLLEQRRHLGGRASSFPDAATGSVVDNGQHILMGCYHSTLRFLSTIGTLDRVRFQARLNVSFLERKGRLTVLHCPGLPSPWHLLLGVFLSGSFSFKEKLEILRLGRSLQSAKAVEHGLEKLTVREWLTQRGQSEGLQHNFWDLICTSALNEDPAVASAGPFRHVLRLALFTSPEDSRILIPGVGLSALYVDAAVTYLQARAGRVECGHSVASLLVSEGQCRGVRLSSGEEIAAERVVSAVPSFQFAALLPGELLRSEPFFGRVVSLRPAPIISINLWFDRAITDLDFIGLRGTTIQWLFNKGKILGSGENYISLVLSGAHAHIGTAREELLAMSLRELGELFPEVQNAKLLRSLVIKERFATFSPTWEAEQVRPPARTPVRGLYLAGDWTATGLPATIESAVQSGYTAAEAILNDFRNH